MKINRKALTIIPAIWSSLFDISITIIHQPKKYWEGNLKAANEANPIGDFMMNYHIYGIFAISILWIITITLLGYFLPRKTSRVFLLFVFIIHSSAAITWLTPIYSFWISVLYIAFNSILFYYIEEKVKPPQTTSQAKDE